MADSVRPGTEPSRADQLARPLVRALLLAIFVVAALMFARTISLVLVVIFSALVIAVALNGPVTWLEQHHVSRLWGTLGMLFAAVVVWLAVALLVGVTFISQVDQLLESVPGYVDEFEQRSDDLFASYPALDNAYEPVRSNSATRQVAPALGTLVTKVGQASVGVATLLVMFITWTTIIVFLTIEPRSVLRMLLRVTPVDERDAVERVVIEFSGVVRGWLWANVLVGAIEAMLVSLFLSWINLPGALVWGVLAFFSVFIPKVGAFVAGAPPLVVALAVDPGDAVWIIFFYAAMTEVMSDVVLPRLQSHSMSLHPVYIVAFVLAFGSSFGLLGAILATPMAGLVAAIWYEFVVSRRPPVDNLDARVEHMLATAERPDRLA